MQGVTASELKEWRARMGLTQADLAKMLEVTETTVYRWENGKAPILRSVELALKQLEHERRKN